MIGDNLSLTKDMKEYISKDVAPRVKQLPAYDVSQLSIKSIYRLAAEAGVTVDEYVFENQHYALSQAEQNVASWESVLASYAVSEDRVGIEKADLVMRALKNSRDDLEHVKSLMAVDPNGSVKDKIIKGLVNQAVKGNVRAAEYVFDRVDGKTTEHKGAAQDNYNDYLIFKIWGSLFPMQVKALSAGSGTIMCMTGRRSGKTRATAALLLMEALREPLTTCIYISPTLKMGEEGLLGPNLEEIIETCDLKDSNGRRLNWKRLDNGSQILVRGLTSTKDPDIIRGHKAKVIVIDEFFHLKGNLLEYLQSEVLKPMQLDYAADYKQFLVGTPSRTRGTYADKMWDTLDCVKFHWTAKDNPYIKNFDKFIEEVCEEEHLDSAHPKIRREYFGERVYDEDALLYPDFSTWNEDTVPHLDIDKILIGVDYGTTSNDAVIAVAWASNQRRGFVFWESKFNRITTPQGVTQLEYLKEQCLDLWEYSMDFWSDVEPREANKRIWWAADCSDGKITEELQYNMKSEKFPELGIMIENAHKSDRIMMQDKIRALLRTGALLLPQGGRTVHECELTVLQRDGQGNIQLEIDHRMYHPDLLPALRYAMWQGIGEEVTA